MENSWTIEQTKNLFKAVKEAAAENKGLRAAFEKSAALTGRSVNSVRNYYYSQLKMFELVPTLAKDLGIETVKSKRDGFELFSDAEITDLVKAILCGKAEGQSVRAVIASLSSNGKEALRLQNKYRSMVAHNRVKVTAIMNQLGKEGKVYYNPYYKQVVSSEEKNDNLVKLSEYLAKLDPGEVGNFLNILGKLR